MSGFNYLLIVIVFEFKEICFSLVEVKASKSSPLRLCNNNKEKGKKKQRRMALSPWNISKYDPNTLHT